MRASSYAVQSKKLRQQQSILEGCSLPLAGKLLLYGSVYCRDDPWIRCFQLNRCFYLVVSKHRLEERT